MVIAKNAFIGEEGAGNTESPGNQFARELIVFSWKH